MNLMQGASDDQMALVGCLVALISSAGLMYLSFFVGPARKRNQPAESMVKKMPPRSGVDSQERAA